MQTKKINLEQQFLADPLDEATHAALDRAEAEIERGEFVTQAEARTIVRKRYQAWQKTQQEALPSK